jgi:GT2 family glycosyltransferase
LTPIRNIDLSAPLGALTGLDGARRCLIVARWKRRVVGRVFLTVENGGVSADRIAHTLGAALDDDARLCWLDDLLAFDDRDVVSPRRLSATVAICTRERPEDLDRALSGVAGLTHRPEEIIVVDNAPATLATRRVVERWRTVRYVHEPGRGLDRARNRALRESRTEIVAFVDDDAVAEPEWLAALLANFQQRRIVCATGLTLPLELATQAQELFEEHCSFVRGFGRRVFDGQRDNPLAVGAIGAGVNMAVRREVALALGGFDERLDAGTPSRSGGDHDLFVRLLAAGHSIAYDPGAVVHHRHRRTIEEIIDAVHGYGVGVYSMFTGQLLERRELGVLKLAWLWFRTTQLPAVLRAADPMARRLARAELRGCARGPWAWLAARRL